MATWSRGIARRASTSSIGLTFSEEVIQAVWNKAVIVPGVNPSVRRKDRCGAWIDRSEYGKTAENGTGWEIDHIQPVSQGGADVLANLQPLQWQNNRKKGDAWPQMPMQYAAVIASR